MRLQRPIQFDQTEYFSEFGSLYEIRLRGAWEIFSNQFTPEELVYSLWALLDDEVFDAETAATLYGKRAFALREGFWPRPLSAGIRAIGGNIVTPSSVRANGTFDGTFILIRHGRLTKSCSYFLPIRS